MRIVQHRLFTTCGWCFASTFHDSTRHVVVVSHRLFTTAHDIRVGFTNNLEEGEHGWGVGVGEHGWGGRCLPINIAHRLQYHFLQPTATTHHAMIIVCDALSG